MLANRVIAVFDAPVPCGEVELAVNAGIGVASLPSTAPRPRSSFAERALPPAGARSKAPRSRRGQLTVIPTTPSASPSPPISATPSRVANCRCTSSRRSTSPLGWSRVQRLWSAGSIRAWARCARTSSSPPPSTQAPSMRSPHTCSRWQRRPVHAGGRWVGTSRSASTSRRGTSPTLDSPRRSNAILRDTGLSPSALTLELTESSVMTEAEAALATLHQLAELGLSWSIDDFGTGYSSLAHLRRLPVSEIKIDKSFVFDLTTSQSDQAIVRSMIDLGRNLGMTVVVEGVETVEVRRRLDELGADRIQGYLLSRPIPAEAFEQWIADRPVRMAAMEDADGAAPRMAHERRARSLTMSPSVAATTHSSDRDRLTPRNTIPWRSARTAAGGRCEFGGDDMGVSPCGGAGSNECRARRRHLRCSGMAALVVQCVCTRDDRRPALGPVVMASLGIAAANRANIRLPGRLNVNIDLQEAAVAMRSSVVAVRPRGSRCRGRERARSLVGHRRPSVVLVTSELLGGRCNVVAAPRLSKRSRALRRMDRGCWR